MPKEINRIKIESDCICYCPMPEIGSQTKQVVDIKDNGTVKVKRYQMSEKELFILYDTKVINIDDELAKKIIKETTDAFRTKGNELEYYTDSPEYILKVFVDKRIVNTYHFPLTDTKFLVELSNMIRKNLNIQDLWLFDEENI